MGNYQNEDEFCTAILVQPLLRRLTLAKEKIGTNKEMANIIDQIFLEVQSTKDFLQRIHYWDCKVASHFQSIEKRINNWIQDKNNETEWNIEVRSLKDLLHELQDEKKKIPEAHTELLKKAFELNKDTINEIGESSNSRSYQENEIPMDLKRFHSLDPKMMSLLYSLVLFPENTELKKRLLIYWWIGLGVEPSTGDTSRTELCELFFSDLVNMGVLIPKYKKHNKLAIDRCIIEPTIHKLLGGLIRPAINMKVLLNLDQTYLNSTGISNNHDLWVVQLGIWQCTETEFIDGVEKTKSNSRIKVDETDFLNKLGDKVTYLSLRGILGIEELHESIGKLENLMILDLNACPHLEKLPQKPRSISKQKLIRWALPQASWFKKLMVLDISGCYLLDHHMPKWICEISNLEVLKGFVVGRVGNKIRSCRLSDISKLNKLRKLSIRIVTNHIMGTVDLSVLQNLNSLLVLTIIWEGNINQNFVSTTSLPKNVEKLDIRCYPESEASELLNPAKLTNLKRLYIRGGKLTRIPCEVNWEVEILRLRYLPNLKYPTDWQELRSSFNNLRYVEYVKCLKPENFPTDGSSWSLESDEPFQRDNAS